MSLGNNIKVFRKKMGLTQEELAGILCVTSQAVSRWESETGLPDTLESTALLVMGYPAEDAKPAPGHDKCRPDSELISWE